MSVNSLGIGVSYGSGTEGPQGPPGRGIISVSQGTGLSLNVGYSDGTNDTVALSNLFNPNDGVPDTLGDKETFSNQLTVDGTDNANKFQILNNSGQTVLAVDTTVGDGGATPGQLNVNNLNVNGVVSFSAGAQSSTFTYPVFITAPTIISGASATGKLQVQNPSSQNVFNVDTSSNQVKTFKNIMDDGNGNLSLVGNLGISGSNSGGKVNVLNNSYISCFNVNTSSNSVSTIHNTLDDGSGNTIVNGTMTALGYGVISGTNHTNKFTVNNSSSGVVLNVDTVNNIVSTIHNTLDDGAGNETINGLLTSAGTFVSSGTNNTNKLQVKNSTGTSILNVNTTTGGVSTKSNVLDDGAGNSTIAIGQTVNGFLSVGGYNATNKLTVNNTSSATMFNVNSSTGAITTSNNTLDTGNGDIQFGPTSLASKSHLSTNTSNNVVSYSANWNPSTNLLDNTSIGSSAIQLWPGNGTGICTVSFLFPSNGITGTPTGVYTFSTQGIKPQLTTLSLGTSGNPWQNIYSQNALITTSDANAKNSISPETLGLNFVNSLKPSTYKMNNGDSNRIHHGLISQEVKATMDSLNISSTDFAGYIESTTTHDDDGNLLENPTTVYALRYEEFISPLIKAIQELSAKVETLETQIQAIHG